MKRRNGSIWLGERNEHLFSGSEPKKAGRETAYYGLGSTRKTEGRDRRHLRLLSPRRSERNAAPGTRLSCLHAHARLDGLSRVEKHDGPRKGERVLALSDGRRGPTAADKRPGTLPFRLRIARLPLTWREIVLPVKSGLLADDTLLIRFSCLSMFSFFCSRDFTGARRAPFTIRRLLRRLPRLLVRPRTRRAGWRQNFSRRACEPKCGFFGLGRSLCLHFTI